jgi:hypothetical protein
MPKAGFSACFEKPQRFQEAKFLTVSMTAFWIRAAKKLIENQLLGRSKYHRMGVACTGPHPLCLPRDNGGGGPKGRKGANANNGRK